MKIVISDCYYESFEQEKKCFSEIGAEMVKCDCKTEDEVIAVAKDCDALICQFAPITKRVIQAMPKCKVIVRYAIGYDNIDWKAAEQEGIYVCNCPDYCIDEVSNHAIALLMDCVRKLSYLVAQVKRGNAKYTVVKPLYRTEGKVLGIVGFGRIGQRVARKMQGFGLHIIAYDPILKPDDLQKKGVEPVGFDELLTRSDFITIHCPLNDSTRHLFSDKEFSRMKRSAILVNTSRGAIIDEKALIKALQDNMIAMAGIDVTETEPIPVGSPLLQQDNAVITSHIAWYSEDSQKELQSKVAMEVVRVLKGEKPLHPVNNPNSIRMNGEV